MHTEQPRRPSGLSGRNAVEGGDCPRFGLSAAMTILTRSGLVGKLRNQDGHYWRQCGPARETARADRLAMESGVPNLRRNDLYFPFDEVRDAQGRIVACRALGRFDHRELPTVGPNFDGPPTAPALPPAR